MEIFLNRRLLLASETLTNVRFSKNFYILHFLNSIVVFSKNLDSLRALRFYICEFLLIRNLYLIDKDIIYCSEGLYLGFNLFGWFFYVSSLGVSITRLSFDLIRMHKMKLKTIIKNHGNLDVISLITKINRIILSWSYYYNCVDNYWDIWGELDIYLYKLLWKWVKKRHPRRNSVWIYNKYWKLFIGSWKFFAVDFNKGTISFLRSHYLEGYLVYRFPFSSNIFDLMDLSKVHTVFFKKFKNLLSGVYRVLWKKQNGLCFVCKQNFLFITFSNIKVYKLGNLNNFLSDLVLVHSSCVL